MIRAEIMSGHRFHSFANQRGRNFVKWCVLRFARVCAVDVEGRTPLQAHRRPRLHVGRLGAAGSRAGGYFHLGTSIHPSSHLFSSARSPSRWEWGRRGDGRGREGPRVRFAL